MAVLIASYLLLVFVLPVALSAIVSYRAMPTSRDCPQCSARTLQVVARWLRIVSALYPRARMQRRWCMECGWEGSIRATSGRQRKSAGVGRARAVQPVRRTTQTLDVCSLDVDGSAWRVMLQCWGKTGVFYGRLVFVGPSGRLWLDAVESFSGSNQSDVLGQALSLPEGLLESRLRRLVTDN